MQSLGDEEQEELSLWGVIECGYDYAVPPYLSVPVYVIEFLCPRYLALSPNVSMDKAKIDLMVTVREVYMERVTQIKSFVAHPEQMENWVEGCKDEGYYCSCCAYASEGTLLCLISHVCELEGTGQTECEELIEDDRVKVEVGSSVESDFEMPHEVALKGSFPRDAFFGDEVHEQEVEHEDSEGESYVIDISEEVDVGVVLIEVSS